MSLVDDASRRPGFSSEAKYYRDVFTPDFRKRNPGLLMPPIEDVRAKINTILTEKKVQEDIQTFLDNAKRNAENAKKARELEAKHTILLRSLRPVQWRDGER